MLEAKIALNFTGDRPYLILEKMNGLTALLDTGAVIPVWVQEENELEQFHARLIKEGVTFTAFGGMPVIGNLYEIPVFTLDNTFFFTNMPLVAAKDDSLDDVSFLLPATMLRGTKITLDPTAGEMILEVLDGQPSRRLKVTTKDGIVQVLYST